ncbi:MAG: hypothetical protein ACREMY_23560, partial [bacterium]
MTDSWWPTFGYDRKKELTLTGDRHFHHLPARGALPATSEAATVGDFSVSPQSNLLSYDLTVSTDGGQTVVAPGGVVDVNLRGPRPVFHYRGTGAVWKFAIASAHYDVTRSVHQDGAGHSTKIAVYHLKRHSQNVSRVLSATRAALDAYTRLFAPLPYSEINIVETPQNLARKADTFGNIVTLPEKDVWLHDYRNAPPRDWVLYTIAREVAKMWWGQQVVPGNMKGSLLLAESLPEYLALRTVERSNGIDQALDLLAMRRDLYLRQRVKEDAIEPSVLDLEDEKFATHKGLLALFEARNVLGPDGLDAALAAYFVQSRGRTAPPFANAAELLATLQLRARDESQRAQLAAIFSRTELY